MPQGNPEKGVSERFFNTSFSTSQGVYKWNGSIAVSHHEKYGPVAIKHIRNGELRKRELEIISQMEPNKNLVRIYGLLYDEGEEDDAIGYVMELMHASLEEVIEAQTLPDQKNRKRLPKYSSRKSIEMAMEICNGIIFLHHANILHRDIKPSNILVSDDLSQVKLCDYGVATIFVKDRSLTAARGTYIYMAPELGIQNNRAKYAESCDVFSLGVTMFELFLKRAAYPDDIDMIAFGVFMKVINGYRPRFPASLGELKEVQGLIERCWDAQPTLRPTTSEVSSILLQILHDNPEHVSIDPGIASATVHTEHCIPAGLTKIVYDEHDYVVLKKTIYGEARGESREGQIAVAWVVVNRAIANKSYWGGNRMASVCLHPHQFACWNGKSDIPIRETGAFASIDEWLPQVLNGEIADPTEGCDHFLNPKLGLADWVKQMSLVKYIGNHHFYKSLA